MRSSAEGSNGANEPRKPSPISNISERKLKANRENAKKSTGPRTDRGKSYSRRNALKHGLCARQLRDLHIRGEDPGEFSRLHSCFRDELQPVGALEELAVQRIAQYQWKLIRAWLCENAVIRIAQDQAERRERELLYFAPTKGWCPVSRDHRSRLEEAEKEIRSTRKVSNAVKETIRLFCGQAKIIEAERRAELQIRNIANDIAKRRRIPLEEANQLLARDPAAQPEYAVFVALQAIWLACDELAERNDKPDEIRNAEMSRELIPNGDHLDNIIRHQRNAEGGLGRAYAELERLQQRRLGKHVLSTVRTQMTQ
jgi:hypothetical protein